MSQPDRLTPEEQEELVAYLDGELDEESTQSLEAKLSQSSEARRETESLKRTWEALDYLPRPQAPADFTHRTIERLEAGRETMAAPFWYRRSLNLTAWAAGLALSALLGFLVVYFWPSPAPVADARPLPPVSALPDDERPDSPPGKTPKGRMDWEQLMKDLRPRLSRTEVQELHEAAERGPVEYRNEINRLAKKHKLSLADYRAEPSPGEEKKRRERSK